MEKLKNFKQPLLLIMFFCLMGHLNLIADTKTKFPSVKIDATSTQLAIWEYHNASGFSMIQSRVKIGLLWSPIVTLSSLVNPSYDPVLARNTLGEAVVLWVTKLADRNVLWANTYANLGGWGIADSVTDLTESVIGPIHVDINELGDIVAVWRSYTPGDPTAVVVKSANTTIGAVSWSTPTQISP